MHAYPVSNAPESSTDAFQSAKQQRFTQRLRMIRSLIGIGRENCKKTKRQVLRKTISVKAKWNNRKYICIVINIHIINRWLCTHVASTRAIIINNYKNRFRQIKNNYSLLNLSLKSPLFGNWARTSNNKLFLAKTDILKYMLYIINYNNVMFLFF